MRPEIQAKKSRVKKPGWNFEGVKMDKPSEGNTQ